MATGGQAVTDTPLNAATWETCVDPAQMLSYVTGRSPFALDAAGAARPGLPRPAPAARGGGGGTPLPQGAEAL